MLQGFGLREDDIVKSFGRLVRRKIQENYENDTRLPMSQEEMIALLDKGPLLVLCNAIFYTLYDRGKKNVYGYNIPEPSSKATKMVYI